MILKKLTWLCSICGQCLTRNSTGNRNNNLHSGVALLVRPYEYIIGRLNGKFSVILHYIDVREASRRTTIMCLLIPFTGSITPTSTAEGCLGAIQANMVRDRRYGNMTRQQLQNLMMLKHVLLPVSSHCTTAVLQTS